MSSAHAIARAVDQAQYVRHDEAQELLIAWHGGHTINVYRVKTGENISCWSLGYNAQGTPPVLETVRDSIEARMAAGDYP